MDTIPETGTPGDKENTEVQKKIPGDGANAC